MSSGAKCQYSEHFVPRPSYHCLVSAEKYEVIKTSDALQQQEDHWTAARDQTLD